VIVLLGVTQDDLSISEYAATIGEVSTAEFAVNGSLPALDLQRELAVQKTCLEAAEAGLLQSAHDCSDGGLAVAIAESCFSSLGREAIGANLDLESELTPITMLFSESPSRIVVSVNAGNLTELERIAAQNSAPISILGRVGGEALQIKLNGEEIVEAEVSELEAVWRTGLSRKLKAEAMAASRE
jgi:phosphoribosylformylglycinamidine synthase